MNGKKRNGKGKEFLDTKLLFEGEYFNGVKNGKGKEYNIDGDLIFEGEYLDGKNGMEKGLMTEVIFNLKSKTEKEIL